MTTSGALGQQRRTLIVEPNVHGHRLFYVRLLIDAARRRGDLVFVGTRLDVLTTAEGSEHLGGQEGWTLVEATSTELRSVERLSVELEASLTVIPDGDRIALALGKSGRWHGHGELSLLVMREVAQPSESRVLTSLKQFLRGHLLRRAAHVSRVRVSVLKSAGWRGPASFRVAVDPVVMTASLEDATSFRDQYDLDGEHRWFGVLGALASRKNIPLVCAALSSIETRGIGLLLAGSIDDDARESVEAAVRSGELSGVKVIWMDKLLTDKELDSAVRAVDCVVLAHSNEGPSGLMGKALAAGTPVVAAGAESLREDAERFPAVMTWVPLDRALLAAALERVTSTGQRTLEPDQATDLFSGALL